MDQQQIPTRQDLEQQGYVFHNGFRMHGYFFDECHGLHSRDVRELLQAGWILMSGGIMEPPKSQEWTAWIVMGALAAVTVAVHFLTKDVVKYPEEIRV